MLKAIAGIALTIVVGATASLAEPVSSQTAKEQLFSPEEMVLEPLELDAFDRAMKRTVRQTLDQLRSPAELKKLLLAGYGYYGGIAFPVEGNGDAPPTIVTQLNSPEAARIASVEACQTANGATCAVAALLLPEDYEDREVTLSQAATARVIEHWDDGEGPKFMAYAPKGSAWGMAMGEGASARGAVDSCNNLDCIVVIADE